MSSDAFATPFTPAWKAAHLRRLLGPDPAAASLPFQPLSVRTFTLSEKHNIDAGRGLVKRFLPAVSGVARVVEAVTRRPFPAFRPNKLWYQQPLYYFNNAFTIVPTGTPVTAPAYTTALDYELQLGFVLAEPVMNARADEAERAIGHAVVFCDFSARDQQLAEMRSGFGVQKTKHFLSSMSTTARPASEIIGRWQQLAASVSINGVVVSRPTMSDTRFSLGEALAHASRGEQLEAGEMITTGCFAGGSGMETGHWLRDGDELELSVEGIGSIRHRIQTARA